MPFRSKTTHKCSIIIIIFIIVNLYKNKQYKITREKCNQASVVMGVTEHYLPTCKLFRTFS